MMWSEILVVVMLVLVNGIFAMSELALVSSRPGELKRRAAAGHRGAATALELLADPSRLLSAVQVGITLVGIVAGAYSGTTLGRELGVFLTEAVPVLGEHAVELAMVLVIGAITYLSLVIGELVPKRLALRHAEGIAMRVAPAMRMVAAAGAPVVGVLRYSTEAILRLLGQADAIGRNVTEEEVRELIAEGASTGVFEPAEKEMIDRVMRLADRRTGSVMTPRPDVVWLDATLPAEDIRQRIAGSRHSRFPVGRGTIDNVVGVLDTRLVLDDLLAGRAFDVAAAVVEAPAVHEGTPVPRLLDIFRASRAAMAIVLDEYGGVEGIVTVSDIFEAIAGEMPNLASDEPAAVRRDDGSWLVDGGVAIAEVEALTGLAGMGAEGAYHTLAGFLLARLAHLPSTGERVVWRGWVFEVVDMDGRRVDRVMLIPPAAAAETSGSGI
ncbi:MAG: HlyC/CorC family transporter [Magnetospirillum sp.]|nr:HlyC/CorC family transporter [Magnetospirillum sp.]